MQQQELEKQLNNTRKQQTDLEKNLTSKNLELEEKIENLTTRLNGNSVSSKTD